MNMTRVREIESTAKHLCRWQFPDNRNDFWLHGESGLIIIGQ